MPDLTIPPEWEIDKTTGKLYCKDCGKIVFLGMCDCLEKYYLPTEKAIEAWNRRA